MDFAFSDGVALGGECRRVAGEEVAAAISRLADFHEDPDLAIHEVRKHNKRIRSVLLLSGSALDPDDLARTNRLVRDAARLFSGARDAFVLQDTCDKLAARFPEDAGDVLHLLQKVRDTFAERHAACLHDRELPGKIARACEHFREAGENIARWDWEQVTREEIFRAILSHYQRGFSDFETARRSRDPEDCHDWRKRTKALSYHLTLLAPLDVEGREGVEKQALAAGELASSLGEHHDLAVFEEAVGEGVDRGVFPEAARLLPALAAKRRDELEEGIFASGRVLYRDFAPSLRRFLHCLLAGMVMICVGGCESFLSPD
ncbi:MAG: CHAD domain-containing protein, partial [Verrucomicrobiaceae bacterium]|nr:CHAD domain-containing protein [Verrucomicrobiaceae bacterium]